MLGCQACFVLGAEYRRGSQWCLEMDGRGGIVSIDRDMGVLVCILDLMVDITLTELVGWM